MHSLSDESRREILGEVLMDELKAIREYVQEIPDIKRRLGRVETKLDKMDGRVTVAEAVVKAHESELKTVKNQLSLA